MLEQRIRAILKGVRSLLKKRAEILKLLHDDATAVIGETATTAAAATTFIGASAVRPYWRRSRSAPARSQATVPGSDCGSSAVGVEAAEAVVTASGGGRCSGGGRSA